MTFGQGSCLRAPGQPSLKHPTLVMVQSEGSGGTFPAGHGTPVAAVVATQAKSTQFRGLVRGPFHEHFGICLLWLTEQARQAARPREGRPARTYFTRKTTVALDM